LVEHPLHGGAADVERHRLTLEITDALHLFFPGGLAHGGVVLDSQTPGLRRVNLMDASGFR